MKPILTIFICIFSFSAFSQNAEKWKHLVNEKSNSNFNLFYLTKTSEAYRVNCKIIKKLDDQFSIVLLKANDNSFKKIIAQPVNHLWKLPTISKNHSARKEYTLNAIDIQSLSKKLTSLRIEHQIQNELIFIRVNYKTLLSKILPIPEVISCTLESYSPSPEFSIKDQNWSINQINKIAREFPFLDGANQIISVKDDFFDTNDIDLLNKHIPSPTQSNTIAQHATAMATIAAGNGNSSLQGKGVAFKAKIQSSNLLSLFPDPISSLQGASIQNHSYGTTIENFYGNLAVAVDRMLFENQNIHYVYSAGNRGASGFNSITGNFKQSKNSIVVGSIDAFEKSTSFSSKGPAFDGRVKPELVAYSTEGTSNSAALTSGILALMQEQYETQNNKKLQNATAKALLINSAKDLGNEGPDFTYGYGNINALKTLKSIQENRIIEGEITSDEIKQHPIIIPPNTKNIKITVAWTDPSATENSNIVLINDLDCTLKEGANAYFPWVLNPSNPTSAAVKGVDSINPIEQIEVKNPSFANATIHIQSKTLGTEKQTYTIVYEFEISNVFEWNYPIANDNFPIDGKTNSPFKWNSTLNATNAELSISYNNGQTWELLNANVNLQEGQFLFNPSEKIYSQALLKMSTATETFISDPFTISYDLNPSITLVCNGTAEMQWNPAPNISTYNIYELSEGTMQLKEQISKTSYSFSNQKNIAVAPVFNGLIGIKSETSALFANNSRCYFDFSSAAINANNEIEVTATLSSLLEIKKIELLKTNTKQGTIVVSTSPSISTNLAFVDPAPNEGFNTYQIKIQLENGTEILSQPIDIIFLNKEQYFVYPTIISERKEINIESKTPTETIFSLFNLSGQLVLETTFNESSSTIDVSRLEKGIYIYNIGTKDKRVTNGKLIINSKK